MSTLPEPQPDEPHHVIESNHPGAPLSPATPSPAQVDCEPAQSPEPELQEEPPILTYAPQPPRPLRFPNMGDIVLVGFLMGLAFFCALLLAGLALHFHLFGVTTVQEEATDIHYTLGSQVVWYCFTFLGCLLVFPLIWHTSFLRGVEWRPRAAFRLWWKLAGAAVACVALAFVDAVLLPGPKEAPIDEVFKLPGAAWLLFLFGITLAPFFEELGFRSFLLPAFCTCFEWIADQVSGKALQASNLGGWRRWPFHAVLVAAMVMVIPVASLWLAYKGQILVYGVICLAWFSGLGAAWVKAEGRSLAPENQALPDRGAGAGWTVLTMMLMSVYISIPFAFMHGEQTGYSLGPFVLLVCVSLVLCWVRLSTRSLAASTMVHASYNLLLFAAMFIFSGGFRHLSKM